MGEKMQHVEAQNKELAKQVLLPSLTHEHTLCLFIFSHLTNRTYTMSLHVLPLA